MVTLKNKMSRIYFTPITKILILSRILGGNSFNILVNLDNVCFSFISPFSGLQHNELIESELHLSLDRRNFQLVKAGYKLPHTSANQLTV